MRKLLLFEKQAQRSGEISPAGVVGREPSFMSSNPSSSSSGIAVSGTRPPAPGHPGSTGPASATGLSRRPRPAVGRQSTARDDPCAHSLLGNLEGGDGSGRSTEFEVNVPLPGCKTVKTPIDARNKNSPMIPVRFSHTTIWSNIVVHHWIKIVLRISKADENSQNKGKRRHFEISIDSPIHLLSVPSQNYVCVNCSVGLKEIHIFQHTRGRRAFLFPGWIWRDVHATQILVPQYQQLLFPLNRHHFTPIVRYISCVNRPSTRRPSTTTSHLPR